VVRGPDGGAVAVEACTTRPRRGAAKQDRAKKQKQMTKKEQVEACGGAKGPRGRVIDLEVRGQPIRRVGQPTQRLICHSHARQELRYYPVALTDGLRGAGYGPPSCVRRTCRASRPALHSSDPKGRSAERADIIFWLREGIPMGISALF
jgi:hypothetical protein